MAQFRKRPVVVEAVRWDPAALYSDYPHWFFSELGQTLSRGERQLFVQTLEGTMAAEPGDWIIRGTAGEIYPCKPEIFATIYEEVETDAPPAQPEVKKQRVSNDPRY